MNIDDLVGSITEGELREQLSHWVEEWKKDEKDVEPLSYMLGKWHGNVWFQDTGESKAFYKGLQEFRSIAIDGLGGLTLNERLYWFGLFEQWDSADDAGKLRIRSKLHANA